MMLGIFYGELFLIIGAIAALIGTLLAIPPCIDFDLCISLDDYLCIIDVDSKCDETM